MQVRSYIIPHLTPSNSSNAFAVKREIHCTALSLSAWSMPTINIEVHVIEMSRWNVGFLCAFKTPGSGRYYTAVHSWMKNKKSTRVKYWSFLYEKLFIILNLQKSGSVCFRSETCFFQCPLLITYTRYK